MKVIIVSAILLLLAARQKTGCPVISSLKAPADSVPAMLYGNFMDDYDIRYTVNDSIWIQHPGTQYHIIKWNNKKQYLVARNDLKNHADPGLYTRIDFMVFDNMKPYTWGFCLTVYNAKTDSLAEVSAHADRQIQKKVVAVFHFQE